MEYEPNITGLNLGVGASGIVKKAFHFSSCKMVAIKQGRSRCLDEISAFQQEAKILKQVKDNEYVIDIIGFGTDNVNNASMMALEYMGLGSVESLKLNENIKCIRHRELIVGYIALNVLSALDGIHSLQYVHNDVKPANILCNKYGEVKLSDFGTALHMEEDQQFLRKNNGTQKYQSPEKLLTNVEYNQKTDVWSLGVTCYELLFGALQRENDENNKCDIKYALSPPTLNPNAHGLSDNCCSFINQCLIKCKYGRPTSHQLVSHEWFSQNIIPIPLKDKWPWLLDVNKLNEHNEDLLFMISSLIIYYSTKTFNDSNNGSDDRNLHRRVSKQKNGVTVSDEERICNIAKYAFCSKDTVMDRIKITCSYIKSQLNKID